MLQSQSQIETRKETIERYINLRSQIVRIEIFYFLFLTLVLFVCAYLTNNCYNYSDPCFDEYYLTVLECSNVCLEDSAAEWITMMMVSFQVFLLCVLDPLIGVNSQKKLACQSFKALVELTLIFFAIVGFFDLFDSPVSNLSCNGFSGYTSTGLCTITTNPGCDNFGVAAVVFIPLAILHLILVYLGFYAIYDYLFPIKSQNRPLLLDSA